MKNDSFTLGLSKKDNNHMSGVFTLTVGSQSIRVSAQTLARHVNHLSQNATTADDGTVLIIPAVQDDAPAAQ